MTDYPDDRGKPPETQRSGSPDFLKFTYSEKAINFCKISTVVTNYYINRTHLRGRFLKNLLPSRIYELYKIEKEICPKRCGLFGEICPKRCRLFGQLGTVVCILL